MYQFFEHLIHEFELPLSNPVLVFSLVLLIILLSPIVLRKLNIPGIIGLIISGVIIGQHGLHILEKNSAVDLFSTIGLLYIMFIAGLELDLNEFKANRNKSLFFGIFTFLFPICIGYPVCYYLLDYDFNASLLTASMFATHTLVAYPIVSKMGISKNQAVAVTVGGTILTDTAVLIILAVIMGNSQGTLSQEWWLTFGVSLTIFSVIMFLIVPRIAKWFFQHLESEKHSHYIFVLSVVFFAAFLAEVAGVEPIIGAFVAGLALNRLIPHSSALMNRIEFIGNSLFIPFFLISVGMVVDVSVLFHGPVAWIIAGALSITALFGKWIAALVTQLIFKYSRAQRQLIFGLSSSHAAATLAVILVGYNAGILDENILNGTIILILITCIVASVVTERASKKIVIEDENGDTLPSDSFRYTDEHLLVPITNVEDVGRLLEFALLIKDRKSPNPISILSVVPNDDDAEVNIIKSRNKLEEYVKQASAAETRINVIATIDHNNTSGIARMSREIMANIILIGWPQRSGIIEKLIGDRVEGIVSAVDKILFICHLTRPLITNKRILVISPPLSERENGFETWFLKICKLAQELSAPVQHYGEARTHAALGRQIKKHHLSASVSYIGFADWEDLLVLARDIRPDDLLVFVSSRKGSVSHQSLLDSIPMKLEKHFDQHNKIVIYPQQYGVYQSDEGYEDLPSGPLGKSIQTIERGIGSIFNWKKKPS